MIGSFCIPSMVEKLGLHKTLDRFRIIYLPCFLSISPIPTKVGQLEGFMVSFFIPAMVA